MMKKLFLLFFISNLCYAQTKNRITGHIGFGNSDYSLLREKNKIIYKDKTNIIIGITYTRNFAERNSMSLTGFTNSTFAIGFGYDF